MMKVNMSKTEFKELLEKSILQISKKIMIIIKKRTVIILFLL